MRSQVEDDVREMSSAFVQHEPRKLYFPETEGRTRQEFAEECDINEIMARYEKTGVISHTGPSQPQYLDVDGMPETLMESLQMLEDAKTAFMTLPAVVRREFDNDAVQFVEFAMDPDNLEQMREWGLAPPKEEVKSAPEAPAGGGGAPPAPSGSPAP